MADYLNVVADKVKILTKHFTPGRGGRGIKYLIRHHLAGILTTEQTWGVWQDRPASAHYVIEPDGTVGQLVWDKDTAWANAHTAANQEGIAIEHANSGGAPGWPISDTVIVAGARWAAALCLRYGLGRPVYGKNIFDHKDFSATGCPMHLANGGKYHKRWMDEAQRFYDELAARKAGKPAPKPVSTKPIASRSASPVNIEALANGVLRGDHDPINTRKEKLGADYPAVQARVNDILHGRDVTDANIDAAARGVLRGKYGTGDTRRRNLGSLYDRVQARVNQLLR